MPALALARSPSTSGRPAEIHWREAGSGPVVVLLHGGWGSAYYPWDDAMRELARDHRVVAPDRSGYGKSSPIDEVPPDFHARAAAETRALLDALGVERAMLWGHSDGAVIAALMALDDAERFPALVLEALHLWKRKPASRAFFTTMAERPEDFGPKVTEALARDHGARWRDLMRMNGRAWLGLADAARANDEDLYGGRLPRLASRALLLHGARDPRTEPGELDAALAAMPRARSYVIAGAGHAPHAERASAEEATRAAAAFLREAA